MMTAVAGGVLASAFLFSAARDVVELLALAVTVACLVRPGVLWLAKRTGVGLAVAAVFIGLVLAIAVLLAAETHAVTVGARALQHAVPDRLERFERRLAPGNPVRRFFVEDDVVGRIRRSIQGIPARFILGTESPTKGASRAGEILLVASLAAFMVTELPKSLAAVISRLPAPSQVPARAALWAGYHAGGSYMRRTLALGGACTIVGWLIAAVCGVPGAGVLGLWLGMWALVPRIGVAAGSLPLVGLAAGQGSAQFVAAVLALAVVAVAAEQLRQRWIQQQTVVVGAAVSLFALMAGLELGRWPGALVMLSAVSVLLAGIRTLSEPPTVASVPIPRSADAEPAGVPPIDGPRRLTIDIDERSLLLIGAAALVAFVAVRFVGSIPQTLVRALVGVLVALALNPLVGRVQRRLRFNRASAVALVVGGFIAATVIFAVLALPRAVEQSRELGKQVPGLIANLDRAPVLGRLAREHRIDQRLASFLNDLPHLLTTRDTAIEGAVRSAGESLLAAGWMLLVLIASLLDGPAIADRVKGLVPDARRPAAERAGNLIYVAVGRSAAGSGLSALLQGGVVLVIGLGLGVPLSLMLAANAAFWSFVPQVGGFMAGAPLVLFALTEGFGTAIAAGVLFLAWMLFNNHVLHPVIVGRLVHISPLSSLVAVLLGGALGGFVGAMVAIPIAAVAHALVSTPTSDVDSAVDSQSDDSSQGGHDD